MNNNKKPVTLTDSRFGGWGWSMVIYSMLIFFLYAGITTDGMNLLPDMFASTRGWDSNMILAYATPASLIGILGSLVFGQLMIKRGPRFTISISLIASGLAYALFSIAPTPLTYAALLVLVCFFASGYGLVGPSTIMSNWFPKKKGIALGWASMGAPLASAFFIPLLSVLFSNFGLAGTFIPIGLVTAILGVISFFWIKDYPEQVGVTPDNMSVDGNAASTEEMLKSYTSPFTIKRLLRDRDMWLISLGFGMLWLVTAGLLTQFVPRMMSVGYTQAGAIRMLTITSIIALPGSYLWGWLDQKIGTKKASMIYALSYIVALLLFILEAGGVFIWLACIFAGLGIGGLLNLLPSLVISVYGRYDFAAANRLVSPLASIIRVMAFALTAMLLSIAGGSYTLTYMVYIVCDIIGIILIFLVTDKCKGKID